MSRPVVLLLRSPDEPDPYEEALADAGFDARSVGVLSFERVHLDELRQALEHPRSYDGLIFTSPRAVEAVAEAMPWLPSENVLWHARAVFAVGPRTAEELRAIGFQPEGEEGGSAEMLAEYISSRAFGKPLLFLCGDRRRDELPNRLQDAGVAYEELCVYRTIPRLRLDLSGLPRVDWIVLFSPSGLEALEASAIPDLGDARFAAIGPTTAGALEARRYEVSAVAAQPSPDGLTEAIRAADEAR